jgi:hypothetical protein
MKKNFSPPSWEDFFDESHFEKTGEALLFRNQVSISEQNHQKVTVGTCLPSSDEMRQHTFINKPVASGFTAYIGHDELQPGYNSLKSNIQSERNFYTKDYYRNYTERKRARFLTENEMLPNPLTGIALELAFYRRLVEEERRCFNSSRKFYSECMNPEDRILKKRLSEYALQYLELIQSTLTELEGKSNTPGLSEKMLHEHSSAIIHHLPGKSEFEESSQPIRGIRALAKFLGVGVNTAQKLKNEGIIPCFQNGNVVLFDKTKVMDALRANKLKK